MKSRVYQTFGLRFKSSLSLEPLRPANPVCGGLPTVNILEGRVESGCPRATVSSPVAYRATPGLFYCDVHTAGKFSVTEKQIVVERSEPSDDVLWRSYLLGPVFAVAAYLNSRVLLHASAVEIRDQVVAFCGDSGAGKSTTSAILENAGHPLVTDDILSLAPATGNRFDCYSGPPFSKLDERGMRLADRSLERNEYQIDKYHLFSGNWSLDRPRSLAALFTLESSPDSDVIEISKIGGVDKIQTLFRYLYRNYLIADLGLAESINRHAVTLSTGIPIFKLQRPAVKAASPSGIVDAIMGILEREGIA